MLDAVSRYVHQRPINGMIDRRKGASADLSQVVLEWIDRTSCVELEPAAIT